MCFKDKDGQDELEKALQNMIRVTKSFDNFQTMMKTTRSFDEEIERQKKESEKAIADAFKKMIDLSYSLEVESEKKFRYSPNDISIEKFPAAGDKFFNLLVAKLPRKVRKFPHAFRRNPGLVIKYFLAMIVGRILAILLYVLAAFIPALPVPDSVSSWLGKPPTFLGSAFTAMRGFVVDFNPQMIATTVSNIPTDINKLLQKIGEFFQYYAKRVASFSVKAIRHPRLAFEDIRSGIRKHAPLCLRLCKSGVGLAFSFLLIKLAMIFLLPLFGGIALTVLGIKVSIILFVVARMIADKIGEFLGKHVFRKIVRLLRFIQAVRNMLTGWK